jgi:DME family drug/metabolite transporter
VSRSPGAAGSGLAVPAIALAAALWATNGVVASSLFDAGVTPVALALARAVVTAAGLALLPAARPRVPGGPSAQVVALGLGIASVNGTYYLAIERLPVAVAIVLQYTGPALVVAWTAFALHRPVGAPVAGALAAALAGVVLVTELPAGSVGELDAVGVAMGLGAAVSFAAYTLLSERARAAYGTLGALRRGFTVAALFWAAVQLPFGWPDALFEPGNVGRVAYVGVFGTLVPFLLFVWAIGHVRSERASIAATLEPVLGAVAAWFWLDQSLSPMQLAGGALVVAAVVVVQATAASAQAQARSARRSPMRGANLKP